MNLQNSLRCGCVAGLLAASPAATHGQSADALLDKLVQKGILTSEEAADLRKQSDQGFQKAYQQKSGMADWVNSFQVKGDFRGRFERQDAEDPAYYTRDRFRYRARVGFYAALVDDFDLGFRLASGNSQFNPSGTLVGASPVTANTDMSSLGSRKFLWMDAAYARWTPIKSSDWTLSGVIGKMDNPFQLSGMVFDPDINPEGGALVASHKFNEQHTVRGVAGYFILDEINQSAPGVPAGTVNPEDDPAMVGGQLLLESKWTPKFETTLGFAAFGLDAKSSLSAKSQPFYNAGNTRNVDGFLANDFRPLIGSASATYMFEGVPLYPGAFPVKLSGEYLNNPGAGQDNEGYRVGVTFGKAGKKRTWELAYRYQWLEADAWFDAMVDDDNGGFYSKGNPQLVGTGKTSGWYGGTNTRGHLVQGTYSFTDFLNLSVTYYLNDLIIDVPPSVALPGQSSGASHLMIDLMVKF